jgi:hypothetical protein
MADSEVKLIITTDASGAITGIKQAQQAMQELESQTSGLTSLMTSHWMGMAAAIVGIPLSISAAWNMADMAAKFQEQTTLLDRLAAAWGTTAGNIVSSIQNASKGLISLRVATQDAGMALQKGLVTPDMLTQLASAAFTLSKFAQQDTAEVFTNLVNAVSSGRARAMNKLAGLTDLHTQFTDAQVAGMSKIQQAQATYAMVMGKVKTIQDQVADSGDSVADKMARMKVAVEDLQLTLGGGLIKAGAAVVSIFYGVATAVSEAQLQLTRLFQVGEQMEKGSLAGAADSIAALFGGGKSKGVRVDIATGTQTALGGPSTAEQGIKDRIAGYQQKMSDYMGLLSNPTAALGGALGGKGGLFGDQDFSKKTSGYQTVLDQLAVAQLQWQKQVDATSPSLDTYGKKIQDLTDKADILTKHWQAEATKTGYKLDTGWIGAGLSQMIGNIGAAEGQKLQGTEIQTRFAFSAATIAGAQQVADLTSKIAAAQGVDTAAVDLANKYLYENQTLNDNIFKTRAELALAEAEGNRQAQAQLKGQLDVMELQLTNRTQQQTLAEKALAIAKERAALEGSVSRGLAGVTVAEQVGMITPAASTQAQMALHQQLLDKANSDMAAVIAVNGTPTQDLLNRIDAQINAITSLNYKLTQYTGTYQQGMYMGLRQYALDQGSNYQQGVVFATDAAKGAHDTMQSVFFDAMSGQWKGATTYALQFVQSLEKALSDLLSKQLMQQILGFNSQSGSFTGGGLLGKLGLGGSSMPSQYGVGATGGGSFYDIGLSHGGVLSHGEVTPFARGGIFGRPTLFPMARGYGLMGEAGAEAVMPLARTASGHLGVKASGVGGGGTSNTFIIQAMDSKSFLDFCNRNPGAIVKQVDRNLKDNGALRQTLQRTK